MISSHKKMTKQCKVWYRHDSMYTTFSSNAIKSDTSKTIIMYSPSRASKAEEAKALLKAKGPVKLSIYGPSMHANVRAFSLA